MLERDLQDYLFENPDVLFPNQVIDRKRREVFIEGRRIDLLFEVDGVHYIIELKRDTIRREDIGQVFEYYGLMRQSNETADFKMILVAPSIPAYRRIPLEEFGIRCVEVPHQQASVQDQAVLVSNAVDQKRREPPLPNRAAILSSLDQIRCEDILPPVTAASFAISHLLLRDGLPFIEKAFSEYEVRPVPMTSPHSHDIFCFPEKGEDSRFVRGGAWWAYRFGHCDEMPKNDVPNISVAALPWGLDFAINAELRTSQEVMRRKIEESPERFDGLVREHGMLEWQAWLKLEHQPRFYHWVAIRRSPAGTWGGRDLLGLYRQSELNFSELRLQWLTWIKERRTELTPRQMEHMERSNRQLNLALRLVHSFQQDDPLWSRPYAEQKIGFQDQYRRLKPFIDFFR